MTSKTFYTDALADDAYERGTGEFKSDDNKTYVYSNTDAENYSYICAGIRFPNITIGAGATISTAYFRITATYMSENNANFTLFGNAANNALNFVDSATIIARDRTTANASFVYNSLGMDWFGADQEIKTIIQEIIDRPGWAASNAICLLLIGNTDSNKKVRFASDHGGVHADGPELHIEYTGGTDPVTTYRQIMTTQSNFW
jgi:hypothetical protein